MQVAALDAGLAHLASLLPGVDPLTPGAGAAGGAGFGLLAWGATLEPGSAAVAALIGLPAAAAAASVVITGEGSFDGQSAAGKVPAHVAEAAGRDTRGAGRGAHRTGCRHLGLRRIRSRSPSWPGPRRRRCRIRRLAPGGRSAIRARALLSRRRRHRHPSTTPVHFAR